MKKLRRVLPVLLLTSLSGVSVHAQAHDSYGTSTVTSMGASQTKQYNPWRQAPQRQWGGKYSQPTATVQRQTYTPAYVVPMSPIFARQYEYRNYVQQVNPYYANSGPWWADPVAVPYGPWSVGNGWPNGIW